MDNALAIRSIDDVQKTAEIMVASGFFKDATDVAKACVKIMAGQELGISPMAAMRGIHIVEGQPQIGAHLMGAMIKRSGKYDYDVTRQDNEACSIKFLRGDAELGTSTFTMEDAKRAGLAGRGQWNKYPAAMLYSRTLSQGARMYCPDIFLGSIYYEGEIEEAKAIERNVTPKDAAPPDAPQNQRKGLVAGWNAETQTMDVYQPVDNGGVPTEEEHDDTPDAMPVRPGQRGKLLGMFKQLGVREGDKRELFDLLNLDDDSAQALENKIVEGGADRFPWQVLSVYIGMLRDRTGKTNEDIADYCSSQWNERHPANLDRKGRDAMFEWLEGFTIEQGEEEAIDEMAEWIEASGVTSEQLASMSDIDIAKDIEAWKKLKAHQEATA